jgi:hypothetical protein
MDPLVSHKDCVQMMIQEVWKVTGYRFMHVICHDYHHTGPADIGLCLPFRVKDNRKMKTGHKTFLSCSQDKDSKQKI